MKLLLTSAGLKNQSIVNALFELVDKKPEETSVIFITTASNAEFGDKTWLIDDLINLKKQNFKQIELADISIEENLWKPKIEQADILLFGGGNTYHLMEWLNRSGLTSLLPELLKTKVFAGISAGSMVTNKNLSLKLSQTLFEEDLDRTEEMKGLCFVDFTFLPHLNSEWFKKLRKENIKEAVQGMTEKIYVADDNTALKVVGNSVEIISEGEFLEFN